VDLNLGQMDRLRALNDEMRSMVNGWPDSFMKGDAIDAIAGIDAATGETDRALDGLDRAIELADPDWRWIPLVRRSEIRQRLGDLEGAKSDCEEAVRADVRSPFWLAARGVWLRSRPGACIVDTGRALDDFDRAIGLAPNWSFAYSWRGETHMWLQKSEQALADFDRAIELSPYFAWPHFLRARLHFNEGRIDEALAGFAQAVELDPYDAEMRQQYGHLLFAMGRLEEGLAAFDEALELIPALAVAHAGRGRVLARLGRCDEAAVEVRRAAELTGQSVALQGQWVHNGIAEVHLQLFYYDCPDHYDLDEALRHAERFATESSMQRTRALALLRGGDYAEAKRIYLETAEEERDGAQFPLAICLWHLGERAEARRVFDRSVAWMDGRLPDNPNWIGLRKEAAELLGVEP
jgi:tetratricopeptide (TPR) repeat protein